MNLAAGSPASALASFVVVGVLVFAAVSITGSALTAVFRHAVLGSVRSPARRADLAWLIGVLPAAAALAVVFGAAVPSGLADVGTHHCLEHGGHNHFCPVHATSPPVVATVLALVLVLSTAARALRMGIGEWRGRTHLRALERLGRVERRDGVEEIWVPGSPRLCHTFGWWRPRIVFSASLAVFLSRPELQAASAHEHAHARRRDPLALVLLRCSGLLVPSRAARASEQAFRDAIELAADAAAAAEVGSGVAVAGALVALARVHGRTPALGMAQPAIDRRVYALLASPGGERRQSFVLRIAGVGIVASALGAGAAMREPSRLAEFHHGVESVIERVLPHRV